MMRLEHFLAMMLLDLITPSSQALGTGKGRNEAVMEFNFRAVARRSSPRMKVNRQLLCDLSDPQET